MRRSHLSFTAALTVITAGSFVLANEGESDETTSRLIRSVYGSARRVEEVGRAVQPRGWRGGGTQIQRASGWAGTSAARVRQQGDVTSSHTVSSMIKPEGKRPSAHSTTAAVTRVRKDGTGRSRVHIKTERRHLGRLVQTRDHIVMAHELAPGKVSSKVMANRREIRIGGIRLPFHFRALDKQSVAKVEAVTPTVSAP